MKIPHRVCAACLLLLLSLSSPLRAGEVVEIPVAAQAPDIDATAWALMEMNSGWIVTHHNAEVALPPASITKLMMNYVVFSQLKQGSISMQDLVPISEKAWRAEGSRMFADVNTKIELGPLLKSTVIQSGNDASIALAEFIGGDEAGFAALMNKTARDLGLKKSRFTNSTGLPDENHEMSAADILSLSAAIIRDYPKYYEWYAVKSYEHNDIVQYNRNKLLWKDSTIDGLKTGYTEEAGFCLVGSAKRDGQRWLAVVLGAEGTKEREKHVLALLDYGFKNYQPVSMLDKQSGLSEVQVFGGDADEVRLQAAEPVNVVVPTGRVDDVQVIMEHPAYLEAPIKVGSAIGMARLSLDGREIYSVPLLAMTPVDEAGWWKGFTDSIKLRWRNFRSEDVE